MTTTVVVMAPVLAPNGGRKMVERLPVVIQTVMAVGVGGDGSVVIQQS